MKQATEILRLAKLHMNCSHSEYRERIEKAKELYKSLEEDFSKLSKEEKREYRNLKDQCHDEITSMTEAYYEW